MNKLDVLLDDIKQINKDPVLTGVKLLAEYRTVGVEGANYSGKSVIRIDINNITIFFHTFYHHTSLPDEQEMERIKDHWYKEILRYILLVRLPIWKESIEHFKPLT